MRVCVSVLCVFECVVSLVFVLFVQAAAETRAQAAERGLVRINFSCCLSLPCTHMLAHMLAYTRTHAHVYVCYHGTIRRPRFAAQSHTRAHCCVLFSEVCVCVLFVTLCACILCCLRALDAVCVVSE